MGDHFSKHLKLVLNIGKWDSFIEYKYFLNDSFFKKTLTLKQHKWYHYCYPTSISLSLFFLFFLTGHNFSCPHFRTRSYYLAVSHFIHAVLKFKLLTTTSVGFWSYIPTECTWLLWINVPSHESWPINVSSPELFQPRKRRQGMLSWRCN